MLLCSFFVPLIMGHGGNTGSQTVSTVIRALALNQVPGKDTKRVLWKEAIAGGIMGEFLDPTFIWRRDCKELHDFHALGEWGSRWPDPLEMAQPVRTCLRDAPDRAVHNL